MASPEAKWFYMITMASLATFLVTNIIKQAQETRVTRIQNSYSTWLGDYLSQDYINSHRRV